MTWLDVHGIKAALAELADSAYQQTLWVDGTDGEIGSIEEATAQLFDDSGLDHLLTNSSDGVFTSSIDDGLRKLGNELTTIVRSKPDPRELVNDERMDPVRHHAANLLFAIVRHEAASAPSGRPERDSA